MSMAGNGIGKGARDRNLDALKGFAIILVMIGHCIVLNHMEDGYLYDAIKAVQMPLFMMASGYLAGLTLVIRNRKELLLKLKKRAVGYLTPFVSWIFVTNVTDFFAVFRDILFQLDRGLWFLMVLFLLTAVLYVAVFIRDCTKLGITGFFLLYMAAGAVLAAQLLNGNTFLGPHLTINYLPFHLLGYLLAKYVKPWLHIKGMKKRTLISAAAALASGAGFLYLIARFDMIVAANRFEWLMQLLASLLGSLVCFYLMYRIPQGRTQNILAYIGTYTLEIYVLHFRFATLLGFGDKGWKLYSIEGALAVAASFAVMSVLTAFFIFTLKKLKIIDFLLFGKQRTADGT